VSSKFFFPFLSNELIYQVVFFELSLFSYETQYTYLSDSAKDDFSPLNEKFTFPSEVFALHEVKRKIVNAIRIRFVRVFFPVFTISYLLHVR
jgi:hypothetical protein